MVKFKDAETGEYVWVDSSSRSTRKIYAQWWISHAGKMDRMFKKCGVDYVSINTREDYVRSLMTLFKKRALK